MISENKNYFFIFESMAFITVTTPQNIEIEYEIASIGDRMLAFIIDFFLIAAYFFICMTVFGVFDSGSTLAVVLILIPAFFYSLWNEVFFNGQSVGKRIMYIKVISLNGNAASFSQYLLRWMFRLVDLWIFSFVVGIVAMAISVKHQRIGDLIAGTTLVKTQPKFASAQTIFEPAEIENYVPAYPEVIHLSDRDMQLIKEVIINIQKHHTLHLGWEMQAKVEQVLGIKSRQHEPIDFLYAVLKDYNHLTAQL